MTQRFELRVQFVDQRNASRNVEFDDFRLGHIIEILDQRPQAVAVRRDNDTLPGLNRWSDRRVPVGQESRDGILQRFGQRQLAGAERRVTGIARRVSWIVSLERRRWNVVTAAPDFYLSF